MDVMAPIRASMLWRCRCGDLSAYDAYVIAYPINQRAPIFRRCWRKPSDMSRLRVRQYAPEMQRSLLLKEYVLLDTGLLEDGAQGALGHVAGVVGDGGVAVGGRVMSR
jgi:hypothetical protein